MMVGKNNSQIPRATSNMIATRPPKGYKALKTLESSILESENKTPSAKPMKMAATIPNNPIKRGTTPLMTNMIENARVPMAQKIIAK